MKVTIIGPNLRDQRKGQFHVHAAGCRDIATGKMANHHGYNAVGPHMDVDADSYADVAEYVYEDMIAEDSETTAHDYVHDFHFAPCCDKQLGAKSKTAKKVGKGKTSGETTASMGGWLVKRERNRVTRTMVEVIDNREGDADAGGLPWLTFCDDHGNYCEHETRKLAMDHSRDPSGWCEGCQRGRSGRKLEVAKNDSGISDKAVKEARKDGARRFEHRHNSRGRSGVMEAVVDLQQGGKVISWHRSKATAEKRARQMDEQYIRQTGDGPEDLKAMFRF